MLFATTVLEVGVNFPNATTMVIESAHMFGLSQLHQLRGRVGRGERTGYCYVICPDTVGEQTKVRLNRFCETQDGFEIAETDLELRGPGDLMGERQSGDLGLKITHLVKDFGVLKKARDLAQEYVTKSMGN